MTVFLQTFGCRLNQAESTHILAAFEHAGFRRVAFGEPADVIIMNSCTVTQKAEAECLKVLHNLRAAQPNACLVLTGCVPTTCGPDALRGLADVVVPQSEKDNLLAIVVRHLGQEMPAAGPSSFPMPHTQRALLKVQDGCPFACAYCIVPHARGNVSRSRPLDDCLAEARALIEGGFQEIVVTGCNTACYGDGGRNLIDLLRALLALPGLGRLRLGSLEPGTLERDIVRLMLDDPKLCRYLHLPIQSGDDGTLRLMGRRYTVDSVKRFLDETYNLIPDISIGTDIITGFPGETEVAFLNSSAFVESYLFSKVHVFPYSGRPQTAAPEMPGQVEAWRRKQRAQKFMQIADDARQTYMRRFIGRPVTLLIEKYAKDGRATGWSAEYLPCAVSDAPPGLRRALYTFTPARVCDDMLVNI